MQQDTLALLRDACADLKAALAVRNDTQYLSDRVGQVLQVVAAEERLEAAAKLAQPSRWASVLVTDHKGIYLGEVTQLDRGLRVAYLDSDVGADDTGPRTKVVDLFQISFVRWIDKAEYEAHAAEMTEIALSNITKAKRRRAYPDGYAKALRKGDQGPVYGFRQLETGYVHGWYWRLEEAQSSAWEAFDGDFKLAPDEDRREDAEPA